ncbi:MAG: chemotaxis protein CheX [Acidobacteriota bacterium]
MDPRQFKLFKQITLDYFAKLAPDGAAPTMEEPYMQFGDPVLLDHTSLVEIHGAYDGCLYLTLPIPMLHQLLAINGEPEISDRTLADMCRELANVLSGNASKAFGGNWDISVPQSLDAAGARQVAAMPDSTFVMPIRWRGATSFLVVGLTPNARTALWNGAVPPSISTDR